MSTDGILEYQGTKRVLFRGDTSNIVFDTRTTSLGIGVTGSNNPSSNLYITGNAYVSSNLAIGGVMTMGVVNVTARHNLQAVTALGNVTAQTVQFDNPTTAFTTTGNVSDLNIVSNVNMLHTANTASIKLNSNVVTEFPRSKKLIKYPRVNLTSASRNAYENGYKVTFSHDSGSYRAYHPFSLDENDAVGWHSNDYSTGATIYYNGGTDGEYTGTTRLATETEKGEWLGLELPEAIKLERIRLVSQSYSPVTNTIDDFIVYAKKQSGDTWTSLGVFTDKASSQNSPSGVIVNIDANDYYKFFAIVATKASSNTTGVSIRVLEFLGIPEYDPDAHGTDVVVKSDTNVPNTNWLEVYHDAKDLENGPLSTTAGDISGLGGTTNNGTAYGNPQISNGAFVLDGTGDYISTPVNAGLSNHTASMWIVFDNPSTWEAVYYLGPLSGLSGGNNIAVYVHSNPYYFRVESSSGGSFDFDYDFVPGKWVHMTVLFMGASSLQDCEIYIDNVKLSHNGNGSNPTISYSITGSNNLNIGGRYLTSNGLQYPLEGKIANFRLFNRILTTDEIYQLYAYQKEYFGYGDLSMTLKAGRLGIGTSEPRAALDVRGRIAREYNPGEIIEELNAICDGSTVMVQSGLYKMANITGYQSGTESHQVITGSTINYTPPPGTKRVYYRFWFKWDAYRNGARSHFQFQIDDVVVTPSKNSISSASGSDHQAAFPVSVEYTIICNHHSDDASNGKFKSWTGPKELECTFRDYSHPDDKCLIHVNEWTDGTGNDSIQKPHLTIRAIA